MNGIVPLDCLGIWIDNGSETGVVKKLELSGAVPEIPVTDLNQALAYYRNNLGFTIDWEDAELGLAGISNGNCRVFLANAEFRHERGNTGPVLTWLNLGSKDEVDELYRIWTSSGAIGISEPESKPWGLHEFMVKDPDENLFRVFYDFGTADGGKSNR
ncbi:MAG: VOC family protein [Pyrinomonadaceae bacterium]